MNHYPRGCLDVVLNEVCAAREGGEHTCKLVLQLGYLHDLGEGKKKKGWG